MGDPTETILNLVLIGGALFIGGTVLIPMLGKLAVPAAAAPAVDANGNPVVTPPATDANGNPLPPTTPAPLPTNTGNPIQDLLNTIINATQGATTPPATGVGAPNASLCHSQYNGSCNSECSSGNNATCQACMAACGTGAAPVGGGANASLCHSQYNGKCDTECKSGNTSTCQSCRIACGLSANLAMADDIYDDEDMPMPVGYYVTMG
jgi:hypothetical protein